uniref:Uncharacterized protein n=1 Tax=Oryza glumipatula TaxID=40148 RepID=A0A0D9Z3I6_9ORYZ
MPDRRESCTHGLGEVLVCARAVSIDRSINLPACSTNLINTDSESLIMQAQAGMVEQPPQIHSVRHLGLRVNYTAMVHMLPRQIEQILKSFPRVKSLKILRCDDVTDMDWLFTIGQEVFGALHPTAEASIIQSAALTAWRALYDNCRSAAMPPVKELRKSHSNTS